MKLSDLRVGRTIYIVRFDCVLALFITAGIQNTKYLFEGRPLGRGWVQGISNNMVYTESLGDLGFPGFAYDDRPIQIFNTRRQAEAHRWDYRNWLNRFYRK